MKPDKYDTKERLNEILDKISKYGVDSLTAQEKEFLDSHKTDRQEEVHEILNATESDVTFKDDFGYFKFEYKETVFLEDGLHYIGCLYVPDLKIKGRIIEGRLEGSIIVLQNWQAVPNFKKEKYDVFEFCEGLEYELDGFLDYVAQQLSEKNDI